ncbi:MAG: phosphoadenosine phosphosulfate reductase family protein [Bacteroidales bacterium]|jgi:phosphoadenosine phosphosulfate reductase|nr:phosphoadenosine phosphosulfate reductase family protein [Bacteroidales bacterium]
MTNRLQFLIEGSISLLKRAEPLALEMNPKGFILAFSGGKDSIVIYRLAQMADIKFEAHYNVTTLDPPENVRFIRKEYPEVISDYPQMTFLQLIRKQKILPMAQMRYCCRYLKESSHPSTVTITGVRHEESSQRAHAGELRIMGRKFEGSFDQFNRENKVEHSCVLGKDKITLQPILNWKTADIWEFIREEKLKYCPLYDEGFTRIGCLFCPMTSIKDIRMQERRYPKYRAAIVRTIGKMVEDGDFHELQKTFPDIKSEEIYKAWTSKRAYKPFIYELRHQGELF